MNAAVVRRLDANECAPMTALPNRLASTELDTTQHKLRSCSNYTMLSSAKREYTRHTLPLARIAPHTDTRMYPCPRPPGLSHQIGRGVQETAVAFLSAITRRVGGQAGGHQ